MKICKDCKHSGDNHPELGSKTYTRNAVGCFRLPPTEGLDLIRGEHSMNPQCLCLFERDDNPMWDEAEKLKHCGREGRFFEKMGD